MTITQLNYIITLEKTRNFTKAANLCKVSQPTLSMQIQKLEEELKVNIFDRTKKPIELSDLGIKIINQAKKILIEFKKMDDILNDKKEVLKGQYIFKNFKSEDLTFNDQVKLNSETFILFESVPIDLSSIIALLLSLSKELNKSCNSFP